MQPLWEPPPSATAFALRPAIIWLLAILGFVINFCFVLATCFAT
jgi:hypothetical protein